MMPLAAGPSWFGVPLVELWFVALFLTLAMFLWLDGTNFGMGILYGLQDDHVVRERILAALAPLWDGAEVWLVVFGGALFAAFPAVYANLFSRHYLLMFAILGALAFWIGIVGLGAGFGFLVFELPLLVDIILSVPVVGVVILYSIYIIQERYMVVPHEG